MRRESSQTASEFQEALEASWRYTDLVDEVLSRHGIDLAPLCGPHTFTVGRASPFQDLLQATDYQASPVCRDLGVAVRVRSFRHLRRYGREFVLRDTAPEGIATEAEKILTNPDTADIYLYAFTDPTGTKFAQYLLVDLHQLRKVWVERPHIRDRATNVVFPDGKGLSIQLDVLLESDCIIAAEIAEWSFPRQREAQATLELLDAYQQLGDRDRTRMELLLMRASYGTTNYRRAWNP